MPTLLLLALLVGVRAGDQNGGIIGGEIATPHSKPWMACLFLNTPKAHICGGALISRKFVLTAAHCSEDKFRDVKVVLGVHNKTKPDEHWQTFAKVKAHFHTPDPYNYVTRKNDIVLLELPHAVTLNKEVQIIPLPAGEGDINPGTVCNVAGWGGTTKNPNGPMSDVLREANVTVLDNSACDKDLGLNQHMKPTMLCAGDRDPDRDARVNDSGGPLVCEGRVEGIVSQGTDKSPPGIYTRVSKYLKWIKKTIGNSG
ncbi:mast cell protease 2-like [Lissotriton helveticus]